MKCPNIEKVAITLPSPLYHKLRKKARQQGLSLPEFIQKKIKLEPSELSALASLPLKQLIRQTRPESTSPEARLDFFSHGG